MPFRQPAVPPEDREARQGCIEARLLREAGISVAINTFRVPAWQGMHRQTIGN